MAGRSSSPVLHASSAPAGLTAGARAADYAVMTLAVLLGGGSIVFFAWQGRPALVALPLSTPGALCWNALLSFVFFAQHSVLVRRPVRAWLSRWVAERYDGAFYAITSGLALLAFALLVQPVGPTLLQLEGLPRVAVLIAALLAVALLVAGARALRPFDMLGLRPILRHLRRRGQPPRQRLPVAPTLVVRGPYRWVRHPLYSAIIVLLWVDPQMSLGRLETAALWTAWICVGAWLEERDLVAEFGDEYRRYQQRVPMLVPLRRPAASEARSVSR